VGLTVSFDLIVLGLCQERWLILRLGVDAEEPLDVGMARLNRDREVFHLQDNEVRMFTVLFHVPVETKRCDFLWIIDEVVVAFLLRRLLSCPGDLILTDDEPCVRKRMALLHLRWLV
jgi:hypothetical protein